MDQVGLEPPAEYWQRRQLIASIAAGAGNPPADVEYTECEHHVWATVIEALEPLWERAGATAIGDGFARLGLSRNRIPQLREVTEALRPLTGFSFEAEAGLVDKETFFGALSERRFVSTQYVRWEGAPLYTPEPDLIHEVLGHTPLLADPDLALLHELAGRAMRRLSLPGSRQFASDVFWFSAEFGVVREEGEWRAYGAGLLSSVGELEWFGEHACIVPMDILKMGTHPYGIDRYQPVLFGAESIAHALEVVGGFFDTCTDESIAALASPVPQRRS